MPSDPPERRGVVELVGDCLRPPGHDRRRPLPIVLLWDPRKSWPTDKLCGGREPDEDLGPTLLDHLEKCFRAGRPYVRRNGNMLDGRRPHEVAALLASHLSCRVEAFGRLKFPRLLLGLAVIPGKIPDRRPLRKALRAIVPELLKFFESPTGTQFVLGLTVKASRVFSETVPLSVRRGLRWYRNGLGEHFADPFDALERLNEYENEYEGETSAKVDEVLCSAFLADLRDGYSARSIRLFKRDENCLALLNDANFEAVRGFLDIIAKQRQDWDPLLIVAAGSPHSPLAEHRHPEGWEFQREVEATYENWNSNRNVKEGWKAWYPLCLDCSCPTG